MLWNVLLHSERNLLKLGHRRCVGYPIQVCAVIRKAHSNNDGLPVAPQLPSVSSPEDANEARSWISRFKSQPITRGSVEMSFSRSSGPGGQNVNKVNTKATLRCPVDLPWIPLWARNELRKSPYYTSSSQTILITSTVHRSQSQNVEECLSKLHALIMSASSAAIKNEPTEQQKARVRGLEKAENARRRSQKDKRSQIKKGRASGKRGDW